jgi:hypothetical protein
LARSKRLRATATLRRELVATAQATLRFETYPGEQSQIDFGERRVEIDGVAVTVFFFVTTPATRAGCMCARMDTSGRTVGSTDRRAPMCMRYGTDSIRAKRNRRTFGYTLNHFVTVELQAKCGKVRFNHNRLDSSLRELANAGPRLLR